VDKLSASVLNERDPLVEEDHDDLVDTVWFDDAAPDDPDDMGRLVGVLLPSHAPKCFSWLVNCTRNRSCSLKIAALSTCGVGLRFRNRQWAWNIISSSIPLSMFDMLLLWRGLLLLLAVEAVVAVVVVALTNRFVVGYRRMD
jgi:hypothetical protein